MKPYELAGWILLAMLLAGILLDVKVNGWRAALTASEIPIFSMVAAPIMLMAGMISLVTGMNSSAALFIILGGLNAYLVWDWWKKRRNRKKRGAHVLTRVRDLGHRLAVAPVKS